MERVPCARCSELIRLSPVTARRCAYMQGTLFLGTRVFTIALTDKEWIDICEAFRDVLESGPPEWAVLYKDQGPNGWGTMEGRLRSLDKPMSAIHFMEAVFAKKTYKDFLAARRNHDVIVGKANKLLEVPHDPQVVFNKSIRTVKHPMSLLVNPCLLLHCYACLGGRS